MKNSHPIGHVTARQSISLVFVWLAIVVVALLTIFGIRTARADIGLAEVCLTGEGAVGQCSPITNRAWKRPEPGDAVLSCGDAIEHDDCPWGYAGMAYREWTTIPDAMLVLTCALDVPIGAFPGNDPCGSAMETKPRIPKANVLIDENFSACSAVLQWSAPVENTDGTPLVDLAGFKVYWGLSPDALDQSATISNPVLTSFIVENLPAGDWFFAATAFNEGDQESELSNLATKMTSNCALADPRPPGGVIVQPDGPLTVYDFVPQTNRAIMLPVGQVPAGTVCIATQAIVAAGDLFFAVPRELVAWAGNVEPDIVYARCQ